MSLMHAQCQRSGDICPLSINIILVHILLSRCSDSECKRRAMYIGAVAAGAAAVGVALYFMYRGLKK